MGPEMTQQSAETESLPLFINFMAVVVSSRGRQIIAPIYLKVVGLEREKGETSFSFMCLALLERRIDIFFLIRSEASLFKQLCLVSSSRIKKRG